MPLTLTDLKYAARLLVKTPVFTLLTVVVLAGGLGISIYTFAALNTLIYGDLPLPDSGSIVRVGTDEWPDFEPLDTYELARIRDQAETVGELGGFEATRALIGDPGATRSVLATRADRAMFEFTRTPPLLGRGFVSEDGAAGAEPVAVIAYRTWQTVFSGDAGVVGDVVGINGRPTRIVGVMPEGYAFPVNTELWLPLDPRALDPADYTGNTLAVYARLHAGVSTEAAEAELTGLLRQIRQQQPDGGDADPGSVSVLTFQQEQWGVLGTVMFGVLNLLALSILLLAAVNVGNLLLARTNARLREIGVRVALGAPRLRLIVQTTLENVIVCAAGGAIAVFLAARALEATNGFMSALLEQNLPFWWTWSLDRDVVAAAAVLLLLTVLVVSVLPASSVSRVDPNTVLKDSTRATGGIRTSRVSRALLTVQVALICAVMLVGGAAAVIAERAASFDFGIETQNLLMMGIELPAGRYATAREQLAFHERLLTELRATPGIDAAAAMDDIGIARFGLEGAEYARPEDAPGAWLVVLSESPSSVGPALIDGRAFDSRDDEAGLRTAIVSESLARTHWPNESPLGRRIDVALGDAPPVPRVIVGVVADVRYDPIGVTPVGLAAIYVPLPQLVLPATRVIVGHLGDEASARRAMYAALGRVDPAIAPNIQSFDSAIEQMTLFARTITRLFAACGAFAVLLAITGIYGMSSNSVALRTHEIGLRRALGASNGNVVAMFIAQGSRQLAVGLSLSVLLSAAVLAVIRQGFSIDASTLTLLGTGVVLLVSATVLIAIYIAVRGVVRREPVDALRYG